MKIKKVLHRLRDEENQNREKYQKHALNVDNKSSARKKQLKDYLLVKHH